MPNSRFSTVRVCCAVTENLRTCAAQCETQGFPFSNQLWPCPHRAAAYWSAAFPQCLQGSELWAWDKKPCQAPPRSLACFVSFLVFSMLPWPAANHPASSSSTTRMLAKIGAERAVAACGGERGLHPLIVDDTEQVGWQMSLRSNPTSALSGWVGFSDRHEGADASLKTTLN